MKNDTLTPLGASQDAPCCRPGDGPAPGADDICGVGAAPPCSPCCAKPAARSREIAGYHILPCVTGWIETAGPAGPAGPAGLAGLAGRMVPRVATRLRLGDRLGALGVRLGIGRTRYRVAPGLYAVGDPDSESHVRRARRCIP